MCHRCLCVIIMPMDMGPENKASRRKEQLYACKVEDTEE